MRASPRPPWRILLLALLVAASGCTTTPAPQQPATSSADASAIYGDATSNDLSVPWQASDIVKGRGGLGVGVVTIKSAPVKDAIQDRGVDSYTAQVAADPWLNKVPSTLRLLEFPTVPVEQMRPGTRWLVLIDPDTNFVGQAMEVRGSTVHLNGPLDQVTDDVDGGDKTKVDLDELKAKIKK